MTAFLCARGIPFDVAESWPEAERMAYFIILKGQEGWDFDFESGEFSRQR